MFEAYQHLLIPSVLAVWNSKVMRRKRNHTQFFGMKIIPYVHKIWSVGGLPHLPTQPQTHQTTQTDKGTMITTHWTNNWWMAWGKKNLICDDPKKFFLTEEREKTILVTSANREKSHRNGGEGGNIGLTLGSWTKPKPVSHTRQKGDEIYKQETKLVIYGYFTKRMQISALWCCDLSNHNNQVKERETGRPINWLP